MKIENCKCKHCCFAIPEEGEVMCAAFDKMKPIDYCNEFCCEFEKGDEK